MKQDETLKMHADVQLAVWNFMKNTPFFQEYYDDLKLYFLHTYLYETLYFAKLRDFKPSYSFYKELEKRLSQRYRIMWSLCTAPDSEADGALLDDCTYLPFAFI